jgi:chromosome segregation ATPase
MRPKEALAYFKNFAEAARVLLDAVGVNPEDIDALAERKNVLLASIEGLKVDHNEKSDRLRREYEDTEADQKSKLASIRADITAALKQREELRAEMAEDRVVFKRVLSEERAASLEKTQDDLTRLKRQVSQSSKSLADINSALEEARAKLK